MDHSTLSDFEVETSQVTSFKLFLSCQSRELLDRAISLGDELLKRGIIALDPPTGSKGLQVHGDCLLRMFFLIKSKETLEDAIRFLEGARRSNAVIDCSGDISLLESLHRAYLNFSRLDDDTAEETLFEAISVGRKAISILNDGFQYQERLYSNMGNALEDLYDKRECVDDLNEAIQMYREALSTTKDSDAMLAHRHEILGTALYSKYRRQNSLGDLHDCLHHWRLSVELTPPNDRKLGRRYDNLASGLYTSYETGRRLDDLEYAITCQESSLKGEHIEEEHAERRGNLALYIFEKYLRTRNRIEIDKAVDIAVSAVQDMKPGHSRRSGLLDQAAVILLQRYEIGLGDTAEDSDLEKALSFWHETAELKPSYPRRDGEIHDNFGNGFNKRYHVTHDLDDLKRAITHWDIAVTETPDDHPELSHRLKNQGIGYQNLFNRTGKVSDQTLAKSIFERALKHTRGRPTERVAAGRRAAAIANSLGDRMDAASYLSQCMELLPAVALPTQSQIDLEHTLRELSDLSSDTVHTFMMAGKDSVDAIQAFESTRGIISGLTLDLRTDMSVLQLKHPEIAMRYYRLREFLSSTRFSITGADLGTEADSDLGIHSIDRIQALQELDNVLGEIRSLPGMQSFQSTPTIDEICSTAKNGPVVCFNVTADGSFALMVGKSGTKALPLPGLKSNDVEILSAQLADLDDQFWRKGRLKVDSQSENNHDCQLLTQGTQSLERQMRWLWDVAVEPVLSHLGLLQERSGCSELPSVWWVRTGAMANLPLHAAGDHTIGSSRNTISQVISSYATTLKTLKFAQTRTKQFSVDAPTSNTQHRVLVVAMPRTPGHCDLNTDDEVQAVVSYIGDAADVKVLKNPSSRAIMDELETSTIVHFACHAATDSVNPSSSCLHLGDSVTDDLEIKKFAHMHHKLADVAYLSACATAGIHEKTLADESIHLSSTFQLAGFRHVVGTLWNAYDLAAVRVASGFYEQLLGQKTLVPVRHALHVAVTNYRRSLEEEVPPRNSDEKLLRWACFIHQGP